MDLYRFWNKIVQRFYEPRLCRSVWRKVSPPFVWLAKIPIPAAPKTGFPLRFNTLLGYLGIFTTAHRAVIPHFRFKKDLILYLNSSRTANSGEFKFKHSTSSTFCTNVPYTTYTPLLIFFQVKTISNFSFLTRRQSPDKFQADFYFSIFFRL